MAMKNNVATIIIDGEEGKIKYMIEGDGIVNVSLKNGSTLKEIRVVGMNMMGNGIKAISDKDGLIEIPGNKIKSIDDAGKGKYPAVEKIIKH